ncbi:hypothetical protein JCM15519_02030 [Fundidesulfovibrio butyratiphilus]
MGVCEVTEIEPGVVVGLSFSGTFGIEDAEALKQSLEAAIGRCSLEYRLSFHGLEGADVLFFQVLFALAKQVRNEGRCVALPQTLPPVLLQEAARIGIDRKDFESSFVCEVL